MFIIATVMIVTLAAAPQHSSMSHAAEAMGFDQHTTHHAFTATPDGGSIAVDVADAADLRTRDRIRAHLKEIADAFAKGDFSKPFQTHAEVPPGVLVMTEKRATISYTYSDTTNGGVVRIRTNDGRALDAIHAFLAYQTKEHNGANERSERACRGVRGAKPLGY